MDTIEQVDKRREQILREMQAIRAVERAALSEQMLRVKHKGKAKSALCGPYFVLSRWVEGKTKSRRVPREELSRIQEEVANHKRLQALFEEFADLTERLGQLEREQVDASEAVKKKPASPSRRTRKSSG